MKTNSNTQVIDRDIDVNIEPDDDIVHPRDGSPVPDIDLEDDEIAILAFEYWQGRGCPEGCPEEDWFRAKQELSSRRINGR